jgi:Piwi domain
MSFSRQVSDTALLIQRTRHSLTPVRPQDLETCRTCCSSNLAKVKHGLGRSFRLQVGVVMTGRENTSYEEWILSWGSIANLTHHRFGTVLLVTEMATRTQLATSSTILDEYKRTYQTELKKKLPVKGLEHFKKNNVSILFMILPKKDLASYAALEKVAAMDASIHITCIVRHPNWKPNIKECKGGRGYDVHELKCGPGAAVNIWHNVNLRLGVENVLLNSHHNGEGQLFIRETMVLGVDVTHPRFGSMRQCPSVAAVVGSFDRGLNLYGASIRCQTSKKESIEAFGEMVGDRLDLWRERNAFVYETGRRRYPKRLVISRDGVSESQFQMILKYESRQRSETSIARIAGRTQ